MQDYLAITAKEYTSRDASSGFVSRFAMSRQSRVFRSRSGIELYIYRRESTSILKKKVLAEPLFFLNDFEANLLEHAREKSSFLEDL